MFLIFQQPHCQLTDVPGIFGAKSLYPVTPLGLLTRVVLLCARQRTLLSRAPCAPEMVLRPSLCTVWRVVRQDRPGQLTVSVTTSWHK